ncbi:kremen protein 2-like, partial [Hemiscyllium ocellatum]|uniref:kremen protein 2-like n=1 Tax=Hemiscyllium ocellatum TaxID=170820 RepID=UPI00296755DD
ISECYRVNGADYRGQQNLTSVENGTPCLFWNRTGRHAYNTLKYPNAEWGLGNHNYCRNPDGDVQPWCYVSETDEGIYWKYCHIPSCSMPGYLGCFHDSGQPPVLSGSSGTSTKLTVQLCIRFCRRKGYKYAGVEAGYACFCGDAGDLRNRQRVDSVQCDQVCFGKSSELCGGDGHIGVYDVAVGACWGSLTGPRGVIYSPGYPDDYGPDSNCTWAVRPLGASRICLQFRIFELRDGKDRLVVRDGLTARALASFSGEGPPPSSLTFDTPFLTVHFQSDRTLHAQGFGLLYTGLQGEASQTADSVDTISLSQIAPTLSDQRNATLPPQPMDSIAGWVIYTTAAVLMAAGIIFLYHLWKRSCLYRQGKAAGVALIERLEDEDDACACTSRNAWTVVYKHTRVVTCSETTPRGSQPASAGDSDGELTVTSGFSLNSLISSS